MLKWIKRKVSKSKTPAPKPKTPNSPKRPNLPANMLREIAKVASPRNQRALRAATAKYTRKTLPIGLAVTKVGRPAINVAHRPVINRSAARAKARPIQYSAEQIDRIVPAAYKNPNWHYYVWVDRDHVLFKNTPTGQAYMINKKSGHRRASNVGRLWRQLGWVEIPQLNWKSRTNAHTLTAYYKRANKSSAFAGGHWKRLNKKQAINRNVELYYNGNKRALNKWTIPNLAWWAGSSFMASNGAPYVKRGGQWYPYGSGALLTKKNILENLNIHRNFYNN